MRDASMGKPGAFFDVFAGRFDTIYDGQRNAFMRWVDKRFRSDMFLRFDRTFELLGNLEGKRVLDIGCGSGPYIAEALRRGAAHVTGLDPAPGMLELAMQRVKGMGKQSQVVLKEGYFPQALPENRFDYAIVMGVMDYVEDPVRFVKALRDAITAGAAVSFPSIHWFRSPLRRIRYRLRKCPLYLYSSEELERLMKEAGVQTYRITKLPGAGMDFVVWITP